MNIPNINLNNGTTIPQIGLGLWKVKDGDVEKSVTTAIGAGYRHFDTAQAYGNEDLLANALEKNELSREDVFITTKVGVNNFAWAKKSFDTSLKKLKTDHADLLLLHFPVTLLRQKAWRDLENIYAEGKAKSIGVSNFTVKHLEQLLEKCSVKPVVNQVELHVFLQQPELVDFCIKNDIAIEAYSPLAHGNGMDDPVLKAVAEKHSKTPAQIMLRWCVEQGMIILPKSITPSRVQENISIFDFSLDILDMAELKKLDKDMRTCWDPTHIL